MGFSFFLNVASDYLDNLKIWEPRDTLYPYNFSYLKLLLYSSKRSSMGFHERNL